jgi:diacylglycerol O-acyltransferase / wax synthase
MKQLSGVDASFLYMETSTMYGHVSGLSVFERPDVPGWSPYEAFRHQLTQRLPLIEPLRRRVVSVPLQLDHPYWIEDPDFDLDYHLRETAVPPPGDERRLADLCGRLIGRPLDRNHPLWEAYVIEGLSDDRFAILTKVHHAAIDGASGVELMTILFDSEPHPAEEPVVDQRRPEPVPTQAEILARAATDIIGKPRKLVRWQIRSLRALGELTRNRGLTGLADFAASVPNPLLPKRRSTEPDSASLPASSAPPTPFNRSITPHRRLELRTASLTDLKAIKNSVEGATLNDVVMAVCAGGLRRYLSDLEALPEKPLVAMIPVSIRTGEEDDPWGNRVSAIFASIPTDRESPVERIQRVHQAMDGAKERFTLMPADVLTDASQFSPPAVATRAIRLATRLKIGDRMNPPFNLVISNVPGPRQPMYLAGARLQHYYPVSTIAEGQGLNITVQSYMDTLDFALVGCRELLPDLDVLADFLIEEIDTLLVASGAVTANGQKGKAAGKKAPAAKKPAARSA